MSAKKSTRTKFKKRTFLLSSNEAKALCKACIDNAPIDTIKPLAVTVGEEVKKRNLSQNALMHAGPLADIARYGWYGGRQYTAAQWHLTYKMMFLPEMYVEGICTSEDYKKWDYDVRGNQILVGSTTDLTVQGFAIYLEQIHADGASMGVRFSANPSQYEEA